MFKDYEVLEVYTNSYGEIDDYDPHGIITVNEENEESVRNNIVAELQQLGISVPENWSVIQDSYMNMISIMDHKGRYRYQLKGDI